MKYTWEESDICGGRVIRSASHAANNKAVLAVDNKSWYVVSLTDGLVIRANLTVGELVQWLNSTAHEPTEDDRETRAAVDWLSGRRPGRA